MDFEEIKQYFEQNKDSEEVKNFIGGLITTDRVQNFLSTNEDGKKILQKEKDTHFTKSLETWKNNNLNSLVETEIAKKFPAETEEQKKLRQLQDAFEAEKKNRARSDLKNKAITHLTSKGIPLDFADYFLGDDEETTTTNLQKLEGIYQTSIQQAVENKFKEGGRDVTHGQNINGFKPDMTMDEYVAMREKQGNK